MSLFLVIVVIIAFVILLIDFLILKGKVENLEQRVRSLEHPSGARQTREESSKKKEAAAAVRETELAFPVEESYVKPAEVAPAPKPAPLPPSPPVTKAQTVSVAAEKPRPIEKTKASKSKQSSAGESLSARFAENWTGILGSIVTVMGVAFLGIYAALQMPPFARYLMLVSFSVLMYGAYFFLKRKKIWERTALVLKSSASIVFLFACLGAGYIKGIKWIDSAYPAIGLLGFAVLVNIIVGLRSGVQLLALIHLVTSLIAFLIAPQSAVTLIITAIAVLSGIAVTYRNDWGYLHLFGVLSFILYNIIWFAITGKHFEEQPALRYTALAAGGITGIAAAMLHYLPKFRNKQINPLSFFGHIASLSFLAMMFIIYTTGSKWNTIILACAAIAIFFISNIARVKGPRWVYIIDFLTAQIVALSALFTLGRWHVGVPETAFIIFAEIIVFAVTASLLKERVTGVIGIVLNAISVLAFLAIGLTYYFDKDVHGKMQILAFAALAVQLAYHIYSFRVKRKTDCFDVVLDNKKRRYSVGGFFLIPLYALVLAVFFSASYASILCSALIVLLFFIRNKIQSSSLWTVSMIIAIATAVSFVSRSWGASDLTTIIKMQLPLLAMPVAALFFGRIIETGRIHSRLPVYFLAAILALLGYSAGSLYSVYISGISWCVISIIMMELSLSRRVTEENRTAVYLYDATFVLIAAFIIRYLTVYLQVETYVWHIKSRMLLEIFSAVVLAYRAAVTLPAITSPSAAWKMHRYGWEILILFLFTALAVELPEDIYPVGAVIFSAVLFFAGKYRPRFRTYSVLMLWITALNVAFVSASTAVPESMIADRQWMVCLAALVIQGIMTVKIFVEKRTETKDEEGFSAITVLGNSIARNDNSALFYPLFASLALFLFWSFDSSVLTLLWAGEAFIIFVMSILLRRGHFRYLSMGALVICLIRLVFFDLANSGTLARAIVFIGVGVIMILMNVLYARFKGRYK